ncbi:hypothetical protein CMV_030685 [Castanea mollissima]|uniref:WEB family protein n=1 Tax=Castanea mollissima TaxID=60419 RepID=A0A8J4QC87_9ROSI|nr:hypothetical protein CMV_030685 [Castanea mollissima]
MQNGASENGYDHLRLGITSELEETKQSLEKAKEESMVMANCLSSMKEELDRTRRELQQLKQRESEKLVETETEIEDVKVVEDSTKFEVKTQTSNEEGMEFQKKRYVTFANPPSLAQLVIPQGVEKLERHPSLRRKKKKPLIPLIGGLFSRKKSSTEVALPRVP